MNKSHFKHTGIITCIAIIVISFSCVKNRNGDTNLTNAAVPGEIAEISQPGFHAVSFDFTTTPQKVPAYVNIASPHVVSQDVVITLALDPTGLADYNTANSTSFEMLPSNAYLISDFKVTVKKGQNLDSLPIIIYPDKVDLTKQLAIPLKITDASGRPISQNFKSVIYSIGVKNKYDGDYLSSGTRYNFNSAADAPNNWVSTAPWSFTTHVGTAGASTCTVHAANANGGFGTINITVNANNTVTVAANATTALNALVPTPGKTSTYNPTTKTFHLYYEYTNTTGTFRLLDHVLVRN